MYSTMALWNYLKALKDGLPDPRKSLVNEVSSRVIEQANQEVWQLRFTNESKGSVDFIRSMDLIK